MADEKQVIETDDDLYDDEDTQKDKYLTFHLAGEDYGIEIVDSVEELCEKVLCQRGNQPPR